MNEVKMLCGTMNEQLIRPGRKKNGTRVVIARLNYENDLRRAVACDAHNLYLVENAILFMNASASFAAIFIAYDTGVHTGQNRPRSTGFGRLEFGRPN